MMDFLRRLAPPRETDATRAVAVLPSLFASESPLRTTVGQLRPAQRLDEDGTAFSLDATSVPAATNVLAPQRHPIAGAQRSEAALPLGIGAIEPTRRDSAKTPSLTHAPVEAPDIDADPSALQERRPAASGRAKPASPELQRPAVPLVADRGRQGVTEPLVANPGRKGVQAPPVHARTALPLSQVALAQRTLQSRDDSQVVHVTIGRIDVVASTAPAPAVRHTSTPRQATVTLADYLRGSNGSRR